MVHHGRTKTLAGFLLLLLLALGTWVARAVDLTGSEAPLNPGGRVFEVNPDDQGYLWLADLDAGEVWQVDRASGAYTAFAGIPSPSDARRAADGTVWWGELGQGRLGRLQPATGALTWWAMPGTSAVYGTSVAGDGHVWATAESAPKLYDLDPATNELCTYTLPADGASDYLQAAADAVWFGDYVNGRLYRLTPATATFTYWTLPTDSTPEGIALAPDGTVWYADPNLGFLGRLDPAQDQLTLFDPPRGFLMQMLAVVADQIWYTDQVDGAVGNLDPATEGSQPDPVVRDSVPANPTCAIQAPVATGSATTTNGTLQWTGAAYPPLAEGDGWHVYELPGGSQPYGIAGDGARVWFVDPERRVLSRVDYATAVAACVVEDEDGDSGTTDDRTPVPGWTVYLTHNGTREGPAAVTGSDGCYRWQNLLAGEVYGVEQEVPPEWLPLNGVSHSFGLTLIGVAYDHTFVNTLPQSGMSVYLPGMLR